MRLAKAVAAEETSAERLPPARSAERRSPWDRIDPNLPPVPPPTTLRPLLFTGSSLQAGSDEAVPMGRSLAESDLADPGRTRRKSFQAEVWLHGGLQECLCVLGCPNHRALRCLSRRCAQCCLRLGACSWHEALVADQRAVERRLGPARWL